MGTRFDSFLKYHFFLTENFKFLQVLKSLYITWACFGTGIISLLVPCVAGKASLTDQEIDKEDIFFNAKLTDHTTITAGHTVIFNKVWQFLFSFVPVPDQCSSFLKHQENMSVKSIPP